MFKSRLVECVERLLETMDGAERIGVLVFDARSEHTVAPLKQSARFQVLRTGRDEAATLEAAEALHEAGCDLILTWGMADSLDQDQAAGSLIVPTRVIDTAADEAFETAVTSTRRSDRVVLISTENLQDKSAKRRFGMRYQAVAADVESATVARFSTWNGIRFAVVRCIADTALEAWASKEPTRLHRHIHQTLPVSWRPWFVSPSRMWQRWKEQNRAQRQLHLAAQSLAGQI